MSLTPAEAVRYLGFILGTSATFQLLPFVETYIIRLLLAAAVGVACGWGASVLYARSRGDG